MLFENLNLDNILLKAIQDSGYTTPTEVQSDAIPIINEGKDAVVLAQTGTGKTAAYILPLLQKLIAFPVANRRELFRKPRALVLLPTRELAQQVHDACRTYGKYMKNLQSALITGGVPFFRHQKKLNSNLDILIGTPGRVLDYIKRNKVDFSKTEYLVLDEADRMLDMGFSADVLSIIDALSKERQNLLLSATINDKVKSLYSRFMKEPVMIKSKTAVTKNANILQHIQYVKDLGEKSRALENILHQNDIEQSIIFTATKSSADQLAGILLKKGYQADALHGDMRQSVRTKILKKFKDKELKFLVGTDIIGRGIDVPSVSHVINYDMPKEPEDYVHRIGRTGRAGASGKAITLAYIKESMQHKKIEEYVGHEIEQLKLEGFTVFDMQSQRNNRNSRRNSFSRRGGGRRRFSGRRYTQR